MAGYEGWISIFEDDWIGGAAHTDPQALCVDKESLTFDKAIDYRNQSVGLGRVGLADHLVFKEKKPKGAISFQFRNSELNKVLLAHFQNGTTNGTRYSFYPRTNPLDYSFLGTHPNHAYGEVEAQPYTVSVLKKLYNTSQNGGTNSFFFKHGVCDKLGFQVQVGQDAKAQANFVFRDVDTGTAVSDNPNSTSVGSYATTSPFQFWSATVLLGGASFEVTSFDIQSDQGVQEYSRVGRQDPENYQFGGYTCKGNFGFDLPYDALKHVGSMFGGQPFSFVATLYNNSNEQVVFDLPYCKRLPFDYQFPDGVSPMSGRIPFQAFESNGIYPIKVTVDTSYNLLSLTHLDAILGTRTVASMDVYDAGTGARTLSSFTILTRA